MSTVSWPEARSSSGGNCWLGVPSPLFCATGMADFR